LIFCTSFARISGQSALQVGNLLTVVAVLAMDRRLDLDETGLQEAGILALAFLDGSLWALLLTTVIWRLIRSARPGAQSPRCSGAWACWPATCRRWSRRRRRRKPRRQSPGPTTPERIAGTVVGGVAAAGIALLANTPLATAAVLFPLAVTAFDALIRGAALPPGQPALEPGSATARIARQIELMDGALRRGDRSATALEPAKAPNRL